jgi:hypothetical protein
LVRVLEKWEYVGEGARKIGFVSPELVRNRISWVSV